MTSVFRLPGGQYVERETPPSENTTRGGQQAKERELARTRARACTPPTSQSILSDAVAPAPRSSLLAPFKSPGRGDLGPGGRADLEVLIAEYKTAGVHAESLPVASLAHVHDPRARASMHRVLTDLAFCSALLREAGDDGTVIYAVDWAARRLGLGSATVSRALKRLRACGAIRLVRVLPPTDDRRAGSRVYALTAPGDAVTVEAAAVVGYPEEPVDPQVHLVDDHLVGGAVRAVVDGSPAASQDGTDQVVRQVGAHTPKPRTARGVQTRCDCPSPLPAPDGHGELRCARCGYTTPRTAPLAVTERLFDPGETNGRTHVDGTPSADPPDWMPVDGDGAR